MIELLIQFDEQLFMAINGWEGGAFVVMLMQVVTLVANWPGVAVLLMLCAFIWLRGHPRMAVALLLTLSISAMINQGAKSLVERPRPLRHFDGGGGDIDIDLPAQLKGPDAEGPGWGEEVDAGLVQLRTRPLRQRSFPSGHSQYAFALFVFLSLMWRRGWPAFMTLAVLVALSRVYLGVHFPVDVVVGGLVGSGIGTLGYLLASSWRESTGGAPDDLPEVGTDTS